MRIEASLAEGSADHQQVGFRLGAVRIEASLAVCAADHLLMGLVMLCYIECRKTCNAIFGCVIQTISPILMFGNTLRLGILFGSQYIHFLDIFHAGLDHATACIQCFVHGRWAA